MMFTIIFSFHFMILNSMCAYLIVICYSQGSWLEAQAAGMTCGETLELNLLTPRFNQKCSILWFLSIIFLKHPNKYIITIGRCFKINFISICLEYNLVTFSHVFKYLFFFNDSCEKSIDGLVNKTDQNLGPKTNLNKLKRTDMFSDHHETKLEINMKKVRGKSLNT